MRVGFYAVGVLCAISELSTVGAQEFPSMDEHAFEKPYSYNTPFCSPKYDAYNDLPGPLIIGGQGDSGTRGVRTFFETLGVKMCPPKSETGDDLNFLFMLGDVMYGDILPQVDVEFPHTLAARQVLSKLTPGEKNYQIRPDDVYADYIRQVAIHPDYRMSLTYREKFCSALSITYDCVQSSKTVDSKLALIKNPYSYDTDHPAYMPLWGWKNPRTVLYMREWDQMFRGRQKLLHVIRDGRDVAVGHLRVIATVTCAGFYNGYNNTVDVTTPCAEKTRWCYKGEWDQATKNSAWGFDCRKKPTNSLNFWAVYNRVLYDYGKRYLGSDRYLALRVEDIALDPNPQPTVERVLDFLGIKDVHYLDRYASREAFVAAVVGKITGHSKSYGGNKYDDRRRKAYLTQVFKVNHDNSSVAYQSLKFFGYKIDDWGLEQHAWTATNG